jgi:hypothetical protein
MFQISVVWLGTVFGLVGGYQCLYCCWYRRLFLSKNINIIGEKEVMRDGSCRGLSEYANISVALACEQMIPTERPPLVGEVNANFCR